MSTSPAARRPRAVLQPPRLGRRDPRTNPDAARPRDRRAWRHGHRVPGPALTSASAPRNRSKPTARARVDTNALASALGQIRRKHRPSSSGRRARPLGLIDRSRGRSRPRAAGARGVHVDGASAVRRCPEDPGTYPGASAGDSWTTDAHKPSKYRMTAGRRFVADREALQGRAWACTGDYFIHDARASPSRPAGKVAARPRTLPSGRSRALWPRRCRRPGERRARTRGVSRGHRRHRGSPALQRGGVHPDMRNVRHRRAQGGGNSACSPTAGLDVRLRWRTGGAPGSVSKWSNTDDASRRSMAAWTSRRISARHAWLHRDQIRDITGAGRSRRKTKKVYPDRVSALRPVRHARTLTGGVGSIVRASRDA